MNKTPLHTLTASELKQLFQQGEVSATETVSYFLNRIKTLDPQIGAFLRTYKERAFEKAKELDAKLKSGQPLGPLAGIPIAIKDNIHVKDELTTCASRFLENYKAPFSATVTRLIEEADGIIIGKTNLDEFAMGSSTEHSAFQQTYNPWDLRCTPGGSSGGSAAAVAARLCPIALGSDTGGSIRQPASLCGVVGFKPTYGRVSRYGLVAFGSSLDQIGPFTTTSADTALMMEVIGKHCSHDSTSLAKESEAYCQALPSGIEGWRIGVSRSTMEGLPEESQKRFEDGLHKLQECGCTLVDVDLELLKQAISVYYIVATAEASTNLARFDGVRYGRRAPDAKTLDEVYDLSKEEGFGPEVKRRIMLGTFVLSSGYQDAYYKKAQKVRTQMIECYQKAFSQCDLIATPASTSSAFPLGSIQDPLQMYLEDIFTIPANLAGLPSISTPNGFSKEGKPMGIMFTGPQLADGRVLTAAHAFEQMTKYHQHIPDLAK